MSSTRQKIVRERREEALDHRDAKLPEYVILGIGTST
jgi:hypothetical protein